MSSAKDLNFNWQICQKKIITYDSLSSGILRTNLSGVIGTSYFVCLWFCLVPYILFWSTCSSSSTVLTTFTHLSSSPNIDFFLVACVMKILTGRKWKFKKKSLAYFINISFFYNKSTKRLYLYVKSCRGINKLKYFQWCK